MIFNVQQKVNIFELNDAPDNSGNNSRNSDFRTNYSHSIISIGIGPFYRVTAWSRVPIKERTRPQSPRMGLHYVKYKLC